jgi:hypothetical protein
MKIKKFNSFQVNEAIGRSTRKYLEEGPEKTNQKFVTSNRPNVIPAPQNRPTPPPMNKYSEDDWEILSVKRTSDGEVFSVGDLIGLKPGNREVGKIDRIWQSFEQMRIDIGNLGLVLNDDIVKL